MEGKLKLTESDGDMFYGITVEPEALGEEREKPKTSYLVSRVYSNPALVLFG